jgi:Tfp pilus assembly protein PilO
MRKRLRSARESTRQRNEGGEHCSRGEMKLAFPIRRAILLSVTGAVLLADLALAVFSFKLAAAPQTPRQELVKIRTQVKFLHSDLERAAAIRKDMPAVQQDCDRFELSFPPKAKGYSDLLATLDGIARKSGLQLEGLSFHRQEIAERGLTEIEVNATVTGDYPSVVRFVNALQRDKAFFILNDLSLGSSTQNPLGAVSVSMHLRTYFRA